jgi:hypothetical protein
MMEDGDERRICNDCGDRFTPSRSSLELIYVQGHKKLEDTRLVRKAIYKFTLRGSPCPRIEITWLWGRMVHVAIWNGKWERIFTFDTGRTVSTVANLPTPQEIYEDEVAISGILADFL